MTFLEADLEIRRLADDEFLNRLAEIGKLYGWRGDYIEIREFIEEIYSHAGKTPPDLEPYEVDD